MLKEDDFDPFDSRLATEALQQLLRQVPGINVSAMKADSAAAEQGPDLLLQIDIHGRRHLLACEMMRQAQPRQVRLALLRLRADVAERGLDAIPFLIAPYLSPEAQASCRAKEAGFLDLEGNARLVLDGVFIDRQVPGKPAAERRKLRSIFKPRSAQVLRVLLGQPERPWRVIALAAAAGVSLGQVSNVRAALLDREWACVERDGLSVSEPDKLLDAWRDAYQPPPSVRLRFYTPLHGPALHEAVRTVLGVFPDHAAMAAAFSAARWLAPYARSGSEFFYADRAGLEQLRTALDLAPSTLGENVLIARLQDRGLFRDMVEPGPGMACTSPVQTYLDLAVAGERGREAADHLRKQCLTWRR